MTQTFDIHNNGEIPFKVEINDNIVEVFSNHGNIPLMKWNAKRIFIGESPMNKMTAYSKAYGPDFVGNSILLELGDNQYEFIGKNIFSFSSFAPIVDFVSPVGNNDVPYPFAVDSDGNVYLLIEEVVLKGKNIPIEDPYSYYYKNSEMGFFYIDEYHYIFTYCANPEKNYERLIPRLGKHMYLKNILNGNKFLLTKEEYICRVNKMGNLMSFEAIQNVKVDAC